MDDSLEQLCQQGIIDALDVEFAYLMAELDNAPSEELLLGSALASRAVNHGHVCLELAQYAQQPLTWAEPQQTPVVAPELKRWRRVLLNSLVVGTPGAWKPLVLDERDRLYLYRYWDYEQCLAEALKQRAAQVFQVTSGQLQQSLERLFPAQAQPIGEDWQKVAAGLAVLRGLTVISGGPGTGKTTTLAKILTVLLEQAAPNPLRIGLAAPTGKAAARVQEAMRTSKAQLAAVVAPAILAALPEEASTLHRLLGLRPNGVDCLHDQNNPLNLDILVIDEASMVDLALMAKIVKALPLEARLILLGDKDQLSSVEAGTVFGELCAQYGGYSPEFAQQLTDLTQQTVPVPDNPSQPLQDSVVLLQHSYRFPSDSGIGRLAQAVNQGDRHTIRALQKEGGQVSQGITWCHPAPEGSEQDLLAQLVTGYQDYLTQVRRRESITGILATFQRYRILCPQRLGRLGVANLNERFETLMRTQLRHTRDIWYPGRPVMITRNDYQLQLFNGDIGIALPDPQRNDQLRVHFQGPDGTVRSLPVTRLSVYEPVFAMTIHKSQGSEFDQVALVLPAEDSRVLSRELIYTAITRAKNQLAIWGSTEVLLQAIKKTVQRASGLRDKLSDDVEFSDRMQSREN